jgi:hypothetical protein
MKKLSNEEKQEIYNNLIKLIHKSIFNDAEVNVIVSYGIDHFFANESFIENIQHNNSCTIQIDINGGNHDREFFGLASEETMEKMKYPKWT